PRARSGPPPRGRMPIGTAGMPSATFGGTNGSGGRRQFGPWTARSPEAADARRSGAGGPTSRLGISGSGGAGAGFAATTGRGGRRPCGPRWVRAALTSPNPLASSATAVAPAAPHDGCALLRLRALSAGAGPLADLFGRDIIGSER